MLSGDFYRLLSPYEGNDTAWSMVSKTKTKAVVGYYRVLAKPNVRPARIKLQGLNPDGIYTLAGTNVTFNGDELMHFGIELTPKLCQLLDISEQVQGDYASIVLVFEQK